MKSDRGLSTFADARHSGVFIPIASDLVIFPLIRLRESQKNIRTRLKIRITPLDLDSILTVTRHRGYFLEAKYPVLFGQENMQVHGVHGSVRDRPRSDRPTARIRTRV